MPTPYKRVIPIVRLAFATLAAVVIATPASAQFGSLTKKVKAKTGQETPPPADAARADQGTIVLTSDVVAQLLTGLKAGQAERQAAAKESTLYGQFKRAEAAYAVAQPKCEAAHQTIGQRATEKMSEKMNAYNEKMLAAQSKHDSKLMAIYQDSSMALIDPSCIVHKPEQPKGYYELQREVEVRAEKAEVKASGLSGSELAMVKERATAILQGSTPGDVSGSEKSAVSAKSKELKPLLGFQEPAPAQAAAPAPTPAPEATTAPANQVSPEMSAAAQSMGECMAKNMQSNQPRIEALAKRAQAAQAAKDQTKLMAIADTVQQIQMAGCGMGR
jgi:hypothetical protein